MVSVPYEINKASDTGKFGKTYDNIKETSLDTMWEVENDRVDLDISFNLCVLSNIVLTIKTPMTITVDLKGKDRVIHTERRREVFDKDLKTAVFDFSSSEKAAKASFRFERLGSSLPIRVVSVVLMPRADEAGAFAATSSASLPVTPQKRVPESISPGPQKRSAVYVLGDLSVSPLIRSSPFRPSHSLPPFPAPITEHTKLKDQPVTQPYSQALLGLKITSFASTEMTEVITSLAGVMGAVYTDYAEKGVDFMVVDGERKDSRVTEGAGRQGVKVVRLDWLLACRDANEQVSHREYLP